MNGASSDRYSCNVPTFMMLFSCEKDQGCKTWMSGYMPRGHNEAISVCIVSIAKQDLSYFCMWLIL